MDLENKKILKDYIKKYINEFTEKELLDAAIKGNYQTPDFFECMHEVKLEQMQQELKQPIHEIEQEIISEEKQQPIIQEVAKEDARSSDVKFTFRLSPQLLNEMNNSGYLKSELIRKAVIHYLKKHLKKDE